jgi:hypothetical protein
VGGMGAIVWTEWTTISISFFISSQYGGQNEIKSKIFLKVLSVLSYGYMCVLSFKTICTILHSLVEVRRVG